MTRTVHTIGHSTRSLEKFLAVLMAHHIQELCNVRAWPVSSRYPHFNRDALEGELAGLGIIYTWLGKDLGGYRKKKRPDSPHTALRSPALRNYADHMESEELGRAIDEVLRRAGEHSLALLCAERHWSRCHRSLISDHLHFFSCRVEPAMHRMCPRLRGDGMPRNWRIEKGDRNQAKPWAGFSGMGGRKDRRASWVFTPLRVPPPTSRRSPGKHHSRFARKEVER